jgi:hypothetical protein
MEGGFLCYKVQIYIFFMSIPFFDTENVANAEYGLSRGYAKSRRDSVSPSFIKMAQTGMIIF